MLSSLPLILVQASLMLIVLMRGNTTYFNKVIQRYLSPVWEVTNVFFVFFFVGIVGFFPKQHIIMEQLFWFLSALRIILLAIRGSYYAFTTYGKLSHKKLCLLVWDYRIIYSCFLIDRSDDFRRRICDTWRNMDLVLITGHCLQVL